MTARPRVSILTPTYNHGRYVHECIESVLAQTVSDWELIVVDDGSTDDTLDRAREIHDPRIRILARDHVGMEHLADTFNYGLSQATGEYFAVIEGDDQWLPDKLERLVPLLADPAVAMAYARYTVIGSHGTELLTPPLAGPHVVGPFDAFPYLLEDSFPMLVTVMIRREALRASGGFRQIPGHAHIDYATFLELSLHGKFVSSDSVVARWRRHATSATVRAQADPNSLAGPYRCRDLALSMLDRRFPRATPAYEERKRRVERSWDRVLARRYWHAGRLMHVERRWADARRLFGTAVRLPHLGALQRTELAVGFGFSLLHIDVEALIARIRGGSPFAELRE